MRRGARDDPNGCSHYEFAERFLLAVIADTNGEVLADHDEMSAIDEFNERIGAAGQRIIALGIATPEHSVLFDNRTGLGHVSSGPAVGSNLFMAGFWVIEVDNETTARELAAEASRACNRRIELRPILG